MSHDILHPIINIFVLVPLVIINSTQLHSLHSFLNVLQIISLLPLIFSYSIIYFSESKHLILIIFPFCSSFSLYPISSHNQSYFLTVPPFAFTCPIINQIFIISPYIPIILPFLPLTHLIPSQNPIFCSSFPLQTIPDIPNHLHLSFNF